MSFSSPNPHCLERILNLSERHAIVATEDIYDDNGVKLWAKGLQVSRELQDKLIRRRLRAPLESSLCFHHALSFSEIAEACIEKIGSDVHLEKISGSRAAREILADARKLNLPPPLRLLLTSAREGNLESFERTLLVVAICAGIAAELQASFNDAQNLLVSAALHDVGELYINPDYLHSKRRLNPDEWKHVASHPRIGQLLIQELTTLPTCVALCVGQHHERFDGSGYPAQMPRVEQHHMAGWIAVADTAAAMFARGQNNSAQLALGLHIVPDEFDRDAAGVLIRAIREAGVGYGEIRPGEYGALAESLFERAEQACSRLEEICSRKTMPAIEQICSHTRRMLKGVEKSLRASGILDAKLLGDDFEDNQLLGEMQAIVREVEWRMRNLARNIYLRAESMGTADQLAELQPVVELLDSTA